MGQLAPVVQLDWTRAACGSVSLSGSTGAF